MRSSNNTFPYKALFLISFLFASVFSLQNLAAEETSSISFLTWSEYISMDIVKEFEEKYGINVKFHYFESDDERSRILLETRGQGFDLILVNGNGLIDYRRQGWLAPLSERTVENTSRHIEQRWMDLFDWSYGYAVPYFWGTFGIAYRKDLVSQPITSWKQFLNPSEELHGKILVVSAARESIGMALLALGYSINSNDEKELKEAEALLMSQKPFVSRFGYIMLNEKSSMVSGKIIAATVYNGDALQVAEHNKNIEYVLPEEGSYLWVDYLVVSANSEKKDLAELFINFINEPMRAARNSEDMYYATPNKSALEYVSSEILSNKIVYPDQEILDKSDILTQHAAKSSKLRAEIFTRYSK